MLQATLVVLLGGIIRYFANGEVLKVYWLFIVGNTLFHLVIHWLYLNRIDISKRSQQRLMLTLSDASLLLFLMLQLDYIKNGRSFTGLSETLFLLTNNTEFTQLPPIIFSFCYFMGFFAMIINVFTNANILYTIRRG